jgi:hypothetical protein
MNNVQCGDVHDDRSDAAKNLFWFGPKRGFGALNTNISSLIPHNHTPLRSFIPRHQYWVLLTIKRGRFTRPVLAASFVLKVMKGLVLSSERDQQAPSFPLCPAELDRPASMMATQTPETEAAALHRTLETMQFGKERRPSTMRHCFDTIQRCLEDRSIEVW